MDQELRAELLRRVEKDQAARGRADQDLEPVAAVDAENLPWLKRENRVLDAPRRGSAEHQLLRVRVDDHGVVRHTAPWGP